MKSGFVSVTFTLPLLSAVFPSPYITSARARILKNRYKEVAERLELELR